MRSQLRRWAHHWIRPSCLSSADQKGRTLGLLLRCLRQTRDVRFRPHHDVKFRLAHSDIVDLIDSPRLTSLSKDGEVITAEGQASKAEGDSLRTHWFTSVGALAGVQEFGGSAILRKRPRPAPS